MHARINLAVLKLVHILWWKLIVKFLRSTDMYVADLVQGRYVRVRSFGSDHLTICGLWQGFALLPRGWGGEGRGWSTPQSLIREGSSRRFILYPFTYHFYSEGTRFVYLLLTNGTPFTYIVRTLHPVLTALNVRSFDMNKSLN